MLKHEKTNSTLHTDQSIGEQSSYIRTEASVLKNLIIQKRQKIQRYAEQKWFDTKLSVQEKWHDFLSTLSFKNAFELFANIVVYFWALLGIFLAFGLLGGRKLWRTSIRRQGVKNHSE